MSIVTRYLTVTDGNIGNDHIRLTDVMDMFPDDAKGGSDESQAAPRTVRVHWGSEFVDTDIDSTKNIFRKRSWVRQFFADSHVQAGDRILIEQLEPYVYRVSKS